MKSHWKILAFAAMLSCATAPVMSEECPGFGSWTFGGLDISETGDALANLISAAPACPRTLGYHLSGECKLSDGIAYIVQHEGAERRIDFKLRPTAPNEQLPFGVVPSDTMDQVDEKLFAAKATAPMFGFSSMSPVGGIVRQRRVSVEVLCDRGGDNRYFFGYWFDDSGRMTAVYEDAFLSKNSVYAPDVTFFTNRFTP